jgi:AraC-like DNA-binding protein
MPQVQPEVPARYFGRLLDLVASRGIAIAPLTEGLAIDCTALDAPEATLKLTQVDSLIGRLNAATGRSDWGFELGQQLRITSHLILGYGILASPTIGYAIQLLARYFSLATPTLRVRLQRDDRSLTVEAMPALPMSHACLVFHADAAAAAIDLVLAELLGERMPRYELHVAHELPHAARYDALRQARCQFGVGGLAGFRMRLPLSVLDAPLQLADAAALKAAEARCEATFRGAIASGGLSGWVRMMLRESTGGLPSLDELSHTLNLSSRTLDRHLKAEGSGFRELSTEIFVERARSLLVTGRPVTAVALELGYTDVSNFGRAFRKATGASPGSVVAPRQLGSDTHY